MHGSLIATFHAWRMPDGWWPDVPLLSSVSVRAQNELTASFLSFFWRASHCFTMASFAPAAVSPPKRNTPNNTKTNPTICHWLPCNMEYDGMAPVHQYFTPQALEEMIYAAQLRGRGLLSVVSSKQQEKNNIQGVLLSFQNGGSIQTQASFGEIREWQHEHSIAAARREPSQVQMAHDWCHVARAVRMNNV